MMITKPKPQKKIYVETNTETYINEEGEEQIRKVERTRTIEKLNEPDYIKIYTDMWCSFNQIPERHRPLFLELVSRMTYCNKNDPTGGQLVYVLKPGSDDICRSLGWKVTKGKTSDSLMKGLKALCECKAIKKVNRGVYQINPSYAGKGEWRYNPRYDRGGIEDLIATFNFKDKTVNTEIIWSDDGEDTEMNNIYRGMLGANPKDETLTLEYTERIPEKKKEDEPVEGQIALV